MYVYVGTTDRANAGSSPVDSIIHHSYIIKRVSSFVRIPFPRKSKPKKKNERKKIVKK